MRTGSVLGTCFHLPITQFILFDMIISKIKNSQIMFCHNITLITKFQTNILNIEQVITNNHLKVDIPIIIGYFSLCIFKYYYYINSEVVANYRVEKGNVYLVQHIN